MTFSARTALSDEELTMVLAGWHVHLDFLDDALDGQIMDWPNWPFDRWQVRHERCVARFA